MKSFNADKPYDQFVCEQLAGDELVGYVPGGNLYSSRPGMRSIFGRSDVVE